MKKHNKSAGEIADVVNETIVDNGDNQGLYGVPSVVRLENGDMAYVKDCEFKQLENGQWVFVIHAS